jgi:hypothetical protein
VDRPERYLSAKELAAEFSARGLQPASYEAMIALIADCDESVGRTIRLGDAIAFLRANPQWSPFARVDGRRKSSAKVRRSRKKSDTVGIVSL